MKFSRMALSAPAVLGVLCVAHACGSPQQATTGNQDNEVLGNAGGGGTGTDAAGASGSGAAPAVSEGGPEICSGESPDQSCFPLNPDMNCNSSNASTDAECSIDCRVPCGFNETGLKHCTCVAGKYESCPCDRPETYKGAPTADFCTEGSGLTSDLDEKECGEEWQQCIATDPVAGTPRGCVCMNDTEAGGLRWFCGSTNNWFRLPSESGGLCDGEDPDPRCFPINPDASCNSSDARSGSECTQGCLVACGFQQMGLKNCVCEGGVYTMCPCPKPEGYLGAATAPPCQSSDGTTNELDDNPCSVEWEQCIGSDPVTGSTPRGCVCMTNRLSGMLQWYCGSTNRWFAPG